MFFSMNSYIHACLFNILYSSLFMAELHRTVGLNEQCALPAVHGLLKIRRLRPCTACLQLSCHLDLLILNIWTCPRSRSQGSFCFGLYFCFMSVHFWNHATPLHPTSEAICHDFNFNSGHEAVAEEPPLQSLAVPAKFCGGAPSIQYIEASCFVIFQQVNLGKTISFISIHSNGFWYFLVIVTIL